MSFAAKKSETKVPMPNERTVLEERVDHIQGKVVELKEAVRQVDQKVDNVQADVNRLRSEVGDFKAKVANDFGDLKSHMATQFGELKAQIKGLEASMIKWMIGTVITATSLAVAVVKLVH